MPTGNIWGITAETSDIAVSGDNPWARTYVIEPRNKDSTTIQRAVRRRQSRQKQQQQQLEEWFLTGDWDDAPGIDNDVHKKATRLLKSELRSSKTAPTDDHDTATSTAQEINDELIKDCIKKAMTKPDSSEPTEEEINASLADYRTKYMSNIQTAYGGAREKLKDEDIRQLTDLDQEFQRMYESEKTKNKDAKSFDIQINDNITFTTGDKNKVSVGGKGTPKEKMEQLMGQLELAKNRNTEPKMNTPINIKLCGSKAVQREKLFHIMKICKERGIDLNNYTLGEDGKRLEAVTIKDMKAGYFASLRRPWKTIPNTVKRCRKTFDLANPNSVAYRKMELDDTSLEDKNGKPFTYESAKKEIKELKKIQGEGGLSDQGEQKLESLKEAIKAHKEKYKTKQTVTVVKSSKGPMGSIATAKEVSKAIAEYKKAKEKLEEDGTRKGLAQFFQEPMEKRKIAFEKAKKQLGQLGIDPDNMDKNNKKIREARKNTWRIGRRIRTMKRKLHSRSKKKKINELIKNIASNDLTDTFKATQKEALTALLAESGHFKHAETQGKKQGLDMATIITNAKARKTAKKEAKGFKSSSMSKRHILSGIEPEFIKKMRTQRLQRSVNKKMTKLLAATDFAEQDVTKNNTSDAHAIKEKLETELQEKKSNPKHDKEEIKNLRKQIKKAEKLITDSNKLLLQTMELNQGDNKIFDKCLERAEAAENEENLKKYLQKEYERRVVRLPDGGISLSGEKITASITIDGVEIALDKDGNLNLTDIDTISDKFGDKNKSSIEAGKHIKEGKPKDALEDLKKIPDQHHDHLAVTEMKKEMTDAALTITQNELGADEVLSDAAPVFMNNSAAAQALIMVAGEEEAIAIITSKASRIVRNPEYTTVQNYEGTIPMGVPPISLNIEDILETKPKDPPRSLSATLDRLRKCISKRGTNEQAAAKGIKMPPRAPTTEQNAGLSAHPNGK